MSAIQTAVRIKPISKNEIQTTNMQIVPEAKRIVMGAKAFDCDFVMPAQTTQRIVFEQSCLPIVDAVIDGIKGTILVYGQTGTGKTHTMFGSTEGNSDGIIYQSIQRMLDAGEENSSIITLSAMEVYLERVTDLQTSKEIAVRKEFQPDVVWVPIKTIAEAESVINGALESRHVTSTNINERSSRGHVIITLKLLKPQRPRTSVSKDIEYEEEAPIEESQLTLVDLAGSENINRSRVQGRAIQEASSINRSLLALKKIILELSSTSVPAHISYRDSKLTLLLQDSIGGYSRTLLIACVSAAGKDIEETRSTLEYTTKARQIRNLVQSEKERLMAKIKTLEFDNQRYKNKFEVFLNEKGCVTLSKAEYDEMVDSKAENASLKEELLAAHKRLNSHANSETYLRVVREVSFLREKEHAEEIKRLRQTNANLAKNIEELGKTHYANAIKSLSDVTYGSSSSNSYDTTNFRKVEKDDLQQRTSLVIQKKFMSHARATSEALAQTTKSIKNHVGLLESSMHAMSCSTMGDESYKSIMEGLKAVMAVVEKTYEQQLVSSKDNIRQSVLEIKANCSQNESIALVAQKNMPEIDESISALINHYENVFSHNIKSALDYRRVDTQPIELEMNAFIENVKRLIVRLVPEERRSSSMHSQGVLQVRNSSLTGDSLKRTSFESRSSHESEGTRSKHPVPSCANTQRKRKKISGGNN